MPTAWALCRDEQRREKRCSQEWVLTTWSAPVSRALEACGHSNGSEATRTIAHPCCATELVAPGWAAASRQHQ